MYLNKQNITELRLEKCSSCE